MNLIIEFGMECPLRLLGFELINLIENLHFILDLNPDTL